MSEISRFTELEAEVKASQLKEKGKLYFAIACFVGGLILFHIAMGLVASGVGLYKVTAFAILVTAVMLGPTFILIFWLGVASADIGQHFLPSAVKGNEIETTKLVKHAASAIAIGIAMLLVAYIWNIGADPTMYIVVIALLGIMAYSSFAWSMPKAVLAVILLMLIPMRNGQFLGSLVVTRSYEAYNTDWGKQQAAEDYQIRVDERDVHAVLAADMAKSSNAEKIAHAANPGQAFIDAHLKAAESSLSVRQGNAELEAVHHGLRPPSQPDRTIDATSLVAQPMNCLDSDMQINPCMLKPGDIIEVTGVIHDKRVTTANGDFIDIGPNGYPVARDFSLPFFKTLPRFAVVGEFHRIDGTVISPIYVGDRYVVKEYGTMYLKVNNDYWNCGEGCQYTPRPYPEWASNNYYADDGTDLGHRLEWQVIRAGSATVQTQAEEKKKQ